jgi:hypothetical protein
MTTLDVLPGALKLPPDLDISVKIWLEQQIWGHRFYNDQTPWLLLLEALGIMAYRAADKNTDRVLPGPFNGKHETFQYGLAPRRVLRQILFIDRHIDEIAERQTWSDGAMWAEWFRRLGPNSEAELGYLRQRFPRFGAFRNAVDLLRSCEVEPGRDRRPTSRHLAPRGPAMLTADYGEGKKGTVNKDRRFFSRGGELLFLMLNRSGLACELEQPIRTRLLGQNSRWNQLATVMQPSESEQAITFDNIGYLPLREHGTYRILGEDWLALLSLDALPDDSLPEPLMRLSGLAVVRYLLERAGETLETERPMLPLDMVSADTVGVRKVSRDAYARHRDMTRRAIRQVVGELVKSDEWAAATRQPNPRKAVLELLKARFGFDPEGSPEIDELPGEVADEAISNHDAHLGRVFGFYAERIGLAVVRQGAGRWYAASDGLLEALVLANVTSPVELESFLDRLHRRYGIVIGSGVGQRVYANVNYEHLKANQRHLEERLRVLGLLKRLSDDCAFVLNPFWMEGP